MSPPAELRDGDRRSTRSGRGKTLAFHEYLGGLVSRPGAEHVERGKVDLAVTCLEPPFLAVRALGLDTEVASAPERIDNLVFQFKTALSADSNQPFVGLPCH